MSVNKTPPGRGALFFGFLHFMKSPVFVPFGSFSGDSIASVCCCSPRPTLLFRLFQARLNKRGEGHVKAITGSL